MLTGLVVLPMTFLSRTPLDCAVHPHLWFEHNETAMYNITEVVRNETVRADGVMSRY